MNENLSYNVSYDNMKKIVKNYFTSQGRNVDLKISSEIDSDRFAGTVTTILELIEKSTIAGVETKSSSYLSIDDLKEIVSLILEQEGKELLNLENNAVTTSRIDGYGMGEHEVKTITGKSFTLTVREKKQAFGR